MKFKDNAAIYVQIANLICESIVEGRWQIADKIPSVRDMAVELQVNPNTVMRSYEMLQSKEILFNKRGLGFYVADAAMQIIKDEKKQSFLEVTLPDLFKEMQLLGISVGELAAYYEKYTTNLNQNENQ